MRSRSRRFLCGLTIAIALPLTAVTQEARTSLERALTAREVLVVVETTKLAEFSCGSQCSLKISAIAVRVGADSTAVRGFELWSTRASALIDWDETASFLSAIAAIRNDRPTAPEPHYLRYMTRDKLVLGSSAADSKPTIAIWFSRPSYLVGEQASTPIVVELTLAQLETVEKVIKGELAHGAH